MPIIVRYDLNKSARAFYRLKHVEESCEHKMSSSEEDEVKENLVEEAYQYLRRKSYPAGASEGRKRCIRRKAAKFVLKNGELFFKKMNKGKASLGQGALNCCFRC